MAPRVKAVAKALMTAGVDPVPPITAILCFVNPSWRVFRRPKSFQGVRFESDRSIAKALAEPIILGDDEIERVAQVVARALPPR